MDSEEGISGGGVAGFGRRVAGAISAMYADAASGLPDEVHCRTCGSVQRVDPEDCLRHGWPVCCGATMTLGREVR